MGKKSKDAAMEAPSRGSDNWVPGWIGGLTSPAAQRSAREWERETLRTRILAFEENRRSASVVDEASASIFTR